MSTLLFKVANAASNVISDIDSYLGTLEHFKFTSDPFSAIDPRESELRIYLDVLKLNATVMDLVLWIDRAPFTSMPDMSLLRAFLVKNAFNISSGTKSALKHASIQNFPTVKCETESIQKKVTCVLQECSDSLLCTPCGFEVVQIKRSENSSDFGLKFRSTCNIQHLIVQVKTDSPAYVTGRVSKGDEVVEINGQVVIGWDHQKVAELTISNPKVITLRLRKRPQPSSDFPGYQGGVRRQRLAIVQQNPHMKIVSSHRNALFMRSGTPKRVDEESESSRPQTADRRKTEEFHEYPSKGSSAFEFHAKSAAIASKSSVSTPSSPFLGTKCGIQCLCLNPEDSYSDMKMVTDSVHSSPNRNAVLSNPKFASSPFKTCLDISRSPDNSSALSNEEDSDNKLSSPTPRSRASAEKSKSPETPCKSFLNSSLLKPKKTNRRISCKDLGQGDCQGWLLLKKSNSFSSKYVKRWCVFKHNSLYYYRNPESAEGLILLHGFTISPRAEVKSSRYAFHVYNDWVRFVFASESEQDRSKWMNKLGLAAIGLSSAVRTARIGGFHPGYVIPGDSLHSADEGHSTLDLVMRNSLSDGSQDICSSALVQALQMRMNEDHTPVSSATLLRSIRNQHVSRGTSNSSVDKVEEQWRCISSEFAEIHMKAVDLERGNSQEKNEQSEIIPQLTIPVPQIRFFSVVDQPTSDAVVNAQGRRKSAELARTSSAERTASLKHRRSSLVAVAQTYFSESSEESVEDESREQDQHSDSSNEPQTVTVPQNEQLLTKRRSVTITAPNGQESLLPYRLPPSAQNESDASSSDMEDANTMTTTLVSPTPIKIGTRHRAESQDTETAAMKEGKSRENRRRHQHSMRAARIRLLMPSVSENLRKRLVNKSTE
ncbi:hypothetical protein Ciccas_006316 [Cichlidogyrus casuarinus]|uniref:Uncharacterized protein n=1 Tax=Cichlidogyrus casuarinus TaxID=1844966 RepID=A0ABD2Q690_9PLAT